MTTLNAKPGSFGRKNLHLGDGILLVRYPEGDCDAIGWPLTKKDRANLASALYDEFEMGNLRERTVLLPNGTEFNIDDNLS